MARKPVLERPSAGAARSEGVSALEGPALSCPFLGPSRYDREGRAPLICTGGTTIRTAGRILGLAGCLLLVTPAWSADDGPLDHFNRANRRFNFWLLDHVFEPTARGYNWVMPKWGQDRIHNILSNLERPRDFVNSLLQAKFARAGRHLGAFVIDSTVGIAGAYRISNRALGVQPPETTAETLGVYHIPAGTYLVLPVYGETCPRCLVGAVGDAVLNPLFWIVQGNGVPTSVGVELVDGLNALARQMPSPRAEEAEWEAYRTRVRERPSYEEAKGLFRDNLELDVAE